MTDDTINAIPSAEALEARFKFVKNSMLRTNSAIYLQYIILLIAMSEDERFGSLAYSIYKDIIIHTASIIESVLEYAVREYIVKGKADQSIFGHSWSYSEIGKIRHECVDFHESEFVVIKKDKGFKTNSRDLGFDDINKAAKKLKIIDEVLYKKAEELRAKRNLIHISSLEKSSNDYIEKANVTQCLDDAKAILLKAEERLNALHAQ